jgi:hypothetical protein
MDSDLQKIVTRLDKKIKEHQKRADKAYERYEAALKIEDYRIQTIVQTIETGRVQGLTMAKGVVKDVLDVRYASDGIKPTETPNR